MYVYVPHPPQSSNPPHNTFRFHVSSDDGDGDSVSKKKEKNRERGTTGIFFHFCGAGRWRYEKVVVGRRWCTKTHAYHHS
ncbi:hypothetical protein Hdeb2414_s0010g00345701 [Helianthus debilis subsp. tardiflorus]